MKFLCPSCKAKYQIADEKVAGRSVRMKCRKCGHMISIAKAVTEGSVSRKLEAEAAKPAPPEPAPPSSKSASRQQKPPVPTRGKPAGWREPAVGAPARTPPARGAPPPRPGGAPRPPPRAPSSPFAAAAPARTAEQKAPSPAPPPTRSAVRATSAAAVSEIAAPAPAARNSNGNGNGSAAQAFRSFAHEAGLVSYEPEEDEQTQIASVGALAGAFSQAVRAPDSSSIISAPSDEWYVGINGVPVGPIRLSELRSKAAVGAITLDSLVWREGFEEWQPLRTFPELIAIVEEGLSSARASLSPLSPPTAHSYTPPIAAVAALAAPVGPNPAPVAGVLSDPFAAPVSAPMPSVERSDFSELALVMPRKSTGAAAWIAVVVALLFGLTIGFVLFSRQSTEPVVKIVEVPAKGGDTPPASSVAAGTPDKTDTVEVAGEPATGKGPRAGGPLPKAGDKEPEKGTGVGSGLKGLSALQGGGPSGGPTGSGSTGSAGGQLDSTQVQQTVSRYTASVKRSCWQPAIDTRAKDAPSSARVAVTITVGPSGSVQNVSTSGDPKGYRGLSGCIAGRVKGWQFPASSGATTVNVPFYFAAQ